MKINAKKARDEKLEVWFVVYSHNHRVLPKQVTSISKKFLYFDEEKKDKFPIFKLDLSDMINSAGLFTTSSEAWQFLARKCETKYKFACTVIEDYEMIKNSYPEALI